MEPNVAIPIDPTPPVPDNHPPYSTEDVLEAVGAPELRRPVVAVRTSRFPADVFSSPPNIQATAGQGLFDPWEVPANGYLLISGAVAVTVTRFTISRDAGQNFIDLNAGIDLKLNALAEEVVHVTKGRLVTVSVAADTTVVSVDVLFVADI